MTAGIVFISLIAIAAGMAVWHGWRRVPCSECKGTGYAHAQMGDGECDTCCGEGSI